MKPKIILVLPAYNLGGEVMESLEKIEGAVKNFSKQFDFKIYITDNGSTDNTYLTIEEWIRKCGLMVVPSKNKEDIGLVMSLKETYEKALKEESDYILKTDLDKDFDQVEVIDTLISNAPDVFSPYYMVIGNRKLLGVEYSEYEQQRRKDIFKIIKDKIGKIDGRIIDPASVGSQLYRTKFLRYVLENNFIKNFQERNGLDFLIPLVTHYLLKKKIKILDIKNCSYNPGRRSEEKIRSSYDTYIKIVGNIVGENPQELTFLSF